MGLLIDGERERERERVWIEKKGRGSDELFEEDDPLGRLLYPSTMWGVWARMNHAQTTN
ncbi:hypothetical protein Syun_014135 [Stephania yunnanensis]|uniref:Uncharacterized protein n=1 Tax=Stephania yunnanensis TaxID=152371 RepID=A0AAP0JKV8_9MAGN